MSAATPTLVTEHERESAVTKQWFEENQIDVKYYLPLIKEDITLRSMPLFTEDEYRRMGLPLGPIKLIRAALARHSAPRQLTVYPLTPTTTTFVPVNNTNNGNPINNHGNHQLVHVPPTPSSIASSVATSVLQEKEGSNGLNSSQTSSQTSGQRTAVTTPLPVTLPNTPALPPIATTKLDHPPPMTLLAPVLLAGMTDIKTPVSNETETGSAETKDNGGYWDICYCGTKLKEGRFNEVCGKQCPLRDHSSGWHSTMCYNPTCPESKVCGRAHGTDSMGCTYCHHIDHVFDYCAAETAHCLECNEYGHTSRNHRITGGPRICTHKNEYELVEDYESGSSYWQLKNA